MPSKNPQIRVPRDLYNWLDAERQRLTDAVRNNQPVALPPNGWTDSDGVTLWAVIWRLRQDRRNLVRRRQDSRERRKDQQGGAGVRPAVAGRVHAPSLALVS